MGPEHDRDRPRPRHRGRGLTARLSAAPVVRRQDAPGRRRSPAGTPGGPWSSRPGRSMSVPSCGVRSSTSHLRSTGNESGCVT
ncbi:hypothetical protein [Ornithinimicrobium kibberense]|uniref:hypothetical protein n=1 Tax=Ornithinimicrobium kibberense TaxID=282060 RepID=UPI00361BCF39